MPFRRLHAEAAGKALQERLGEGDFRQQDQRLTARPHGLGHRLEIDLGLARTGDAIQQVDGEAVLIHRLAQHRGGLLLLRGEGGRAMVGVRGIGGGLGWQDESFQRSVIDQAVHHGRGDPGFARRFRLAAHEAVGKVGEQALAGGGHALRP